MLETYHLGTPRRLTGPVDVERSGDIMKRLAPLALTAATLALTACQDSDQILSPNDPADAPAFSIQQQADQVVPGRIMARLTDGADAASLVLCSQSLFRFADLRGA